MPLVVALLIVLAVVTGLLDLPQALHMAFVWLLPFSAAFWTYQASLSFAQGLGNDHLRAGLIVANASTTLVLTVLGGVLKPQFETAAAASLLAYLLVGFVGLVIQLRSPSSRARPVERVEVNVRVALRESRAYWASNILNYTVANVDVVAAGAVLRPDAVGAYQLARKLAQAVILPFIGSLSLLLGKSASRSAASGRLLVRKFLLSSLVVASLGGTALLLLSAEVLPLLFDVEGWRIVPALGVLLVAFSLQLVRDALSAQAIAEGAVAWPVLAGASSLVMAALLFPIVSSLGATGLGSALGLAFLGGVAVHLWRLRFSRILRQPLVLLLGAAMLALPIVTSIWVS